MTRQTKIWIWISIKTVIYVGSLMMIGEISSIVPWAWWLCVPLFILFIGGLVFESWYSSVKSKVDAMMESMPKGEHPFTDQK